jgi:ferrochelatase
MNVKQEKKTKVIIAQLGSPRSPSVSDVREYLKEFLGDPRVVDLPRLTWLLILYLFVLPFRPKKSAHAYSHIWDGKSFPLVSLTMSLVKKLQKNMPKSIEVEPCFLLSDPRLPSILERWNQEDPNTRAQHVIVIPQFPQYSESTTASVFDTVAKGMKSQVVIPNLTFLTSFHRFKGFINLTVKNIQHILQHNEIDHLLISFHGVPTRRITEKKDIYYAQCLETFNLIKNLVNFPKEKIHLCFQSRFGREEWLLPSTDQVAKDLAVKGAKKIAVSCPSFTIDCLETTVEIGMELREEIAPQGCDVVLVPALNDFEDWSQELSHLIKMLVESGPKALEELSFDPIP